MDVNILVAVRVRPLIAREKEENEKLWEVKDGKYICTANKKISPSREYCFDRVFDTEASTLNIYNEVCLPIVESTMQGFNGTIFAYGQTSSGKTFTMMGEYAKAFAKCEGIIHFCINDIFKFIQKMPDNREFLLRVSFLEIYNEKVYDLLSSKNEDLKLLEDGYGNMKVSGLVEKYVQTSDQIWQWMLISQSKRRTAETQMNRVSSRSHYIFRMIIESRLKDQDVVNVSQLNLVDLAGSENLKQTNKGERFTEGVHINLSLSTLCQVIRQLSEKDSGFIKYRNSKLTRLLQTSLGGNARTAILCAVTPASLKETISTLDFAQRAKKIKNKLMKNEIVTDQAVLKQLEEQTKHIENLKLQIEALKVNFDSQTVKSSRRETWGGLRDTRRFQLENFSVRPRKYTDWDLPTLEEDFEGETDATRSSISSVLRQSVSLKPKVCNKIVSDAETQTELENEEFNDGVEPKTDVSESNRLRNSTSFQTELDELKEYTTIEFQLLKAENELQAEIEDLKQENITLKNEWDAKLLVISRELEAKYEKELAEIRHKLAETESNKLCDFKSFEERNKELEECNRNLEQKVIQLESSYIEQVKEFKLKHEKELAELKCVLSESESNRLSNLKLLEEKNSELEECNRDFKQKINQLEASHSAYVDELEKKYDRKLEEISDQLTEFENNKLSDLKFLEDKNKELEECNKDLKQNIIQLEDSCSMQVKELEAKYKKELDEIKQQLTETQNNKLNNLKLFGDKNRESEECNRNLMKNIIQLKDSHHTQVNELKEKYEKELEEIKQQLIETERDKLSNLKLLEDKNRELEECNRCLNQKIIQLEDSHSTQVNELEAKFETAQSELNSKLLLIKELEEKYQNELHEVKLQLGDPEGYTLNELLHLQEKCKELEQCNKDLNQKLYLEKSHHAKVKAIEPNFENSESELLLKINNLESDIIELSEIKNQLQNKCSALEQYNSDLKQKIADLEDSHVTEIKVLEENFKKERSEWNAKTRALVSNMEAKHEEEITDLENEVTNRCMKMFDKRFDVWIKESSELQEELKNVKLQNLELINIKEQHLKQIKELEEQVYTESLDKATEIIQLKENNKELLALKTQYEKMIAVYKSKIRKCKDHYEELHSQAQIYMEENERIKNQINSDTLLREKVNNLMNENDVLSKKHATAELEINNLKECLEEHKRSAKRIGNSKELEEYNKMLCLDLDTQKAKIKSLEKNNERLIQEVNKLREKIALLKDSSCKCKMNTKGLKVETPLISENEKENSEKRMLEDAEFQRIHKPIQSGVSKKEKDSHKMDNVDKNDPYLHREDCGSLIRCQFLDGVVYQKDKEIKMLKEKCANLNSELTRIKKCPMVFSETKPEMRKSEVKKTPASALRERNEDMTVQINTPLQNLVENVDERLKVKHNRRKSFKPYIPPLKSANSENHNGKLIGQLNEETAEIKRGPQQVNDAMDVIYGEESKCIQQ